MGSKVIWVFLYILGSFINNGYMSDDRVLCTAIPFTNVYFTNIYIIFKTCYQIIKSILIPYLSINALGVAGKCNIRLKTLKSLSTIC